MVFWRAGLTGLLLLGSLDKAAANSEAYYQWTWLGGGASDVAVHGQQGVPDPANTPGTSTHGPSWTDSDGNLWMMIGFSSPEPRGTMWKYDVSAEAWAWMHGQQGSQGASPVFGEMGVPDAANWPGMRRGAAFWTDSAGRFWLYGGTTRSIDKHDDMWMFEPSTGLWTWMAGTDTTSWRVDPVAGADGAFSSEYTPGSRSESGAWIDADGNFWLYGGSAAPLGDLWKFDTSILHWARMRPPATDGQVLGELGVPHPDNQPTVQSTPTTWTDPNWDLWMYGGVNTKRLWRYTLADNNWTWMGGAATDWDGEPDAGFPMGIFAGQHWIDSAGDLWRFGGRSVVEGGGLRTYGDLWKFDADTNQFTHIDGPLTENLPANMGEQGVPDPENHPGHRFFAHTWTGTDGYLYMYGGGDSGGFPRSDLWRFNPTAPPDTSVSNWYLY